MIYLKSTLVGIVALFLSAVVFTVGWGWWVTRKIDTTEGTVGVDVVGLVKWPLSWLIVMLGFAVGFYWEFRSASR